MKKILFIEDNPSIAAALQHALRTQYHISHAQTGKAGIYKADIESFDLILLDLILPDLPGQAVCQQLRERGITTPIMIVSAEDTVLTKISLLDAGANDYMVKPFSLGELKARIRNLLRASVASREHTAVITIGNLIINPRTRLVTRDNKPIELRRKEYAMLECLAAHKGAVVSRRTLTQYAWDGGEENWTNTVDVHIKYLRDKIDRPFDYPLIKTVHGIGYRLQAAVEPASLTKTTVQVTQGWSMVNTTVIICTLLVLLCITVLVAYRAQRQLSKQRVELEQRYIERTGQLEAEQLRRTLEMQRFAEFGRLSAQLLHDVANPLTVASLHLEQASDRTSTAIREARRSLRHLELYVQTARRQLQHASEPQVFSVQKELRQLLLILRPMAQKDSIRIVVQRSDTYELNGDPVKFHQIMANVIANAVDACRSTLPTQKRIVTIKLARQARYLQISVHDHGSGIAPKDIPKIFQPFYTTKQTEGRGLGIGLATVKRSLKEEFHGTICAKSSASSGTTFSMFLRMEPPLTSTPATAQSQPAASAKAVSG